LNINTVKEASKHFFHLWVSGKSNAGKSMLVEAMLSLIYPAEMVKVCPLYREYGSNDDLDNAVDSVIGLPVVFDETDNLKPATISDKLKNIASKKMAGLILCFNEDKSPNPNVQGLRKRHLKVIHQLVAKPSVSFKKGCDECCLGLWCVFPLLLEHCLVSVKDIEDAEKLGVEMPDGASFAGASMLAMALRLGCTILGMSRAEVIHQFQLLTNEQKIVLVENVNVGRLRDYITQNRDQLEQVNGCVLVCLRQIFKNETQIVVNELKRLNIVDSNEKKRKQVGRVRVNYFLISLQAIGME
jgi:hypothetical protein